MKVHHDGFVSLAKMERDFAAEKSAHAVTKRKLRIARKALREIVSNDYSGSAHWQRAQDALRAIKDAGRGGKL